MNGSSLRVLGCDCGPEPVMHDGCYRCQRARRARAYQMVSPSEKAYDRFFDPLGQYHTDFPSGCSCHISPPCSFCVDKESAK